jgi:UDP-N-acetylmuramoyl-tripeptide--D-alanyl-D-alanine ligase
MPIIAVTGSNGKTTVKEMTAAILRSQTGNPEVVLATEGNLNNDIGCPMMMLRLRASHRYAVLEMGMNHPGEIRYLTNLAKPDVALVNNAHMAHIGLMGSVQAIAEAKGEIFEGLNEKGIAIINRDDPHADYWREINAGHHILTFGFHPEADVRGIYGSNDKDLLTIHVREQGEATLTLPVPGEHNARNALAAAACALAVGVDLQTIAKALAGFAGVKGRLQRKPGLHGGRFIDDTYNANPDSTRAALAVLAREAGHKYFVLGDMGELGEAAPALHAQVGLVARQAGVERLFGLGDLSKEAVRAFGAGGMHFERIEELLAEVENALAPDVTVLVKGSRAMRMERVVNSLTEEVH